MQTDSMTDKQVLSSNTDVIIILLGVNHELASINNINDTVVDFGIKKNQKIISIKNLASSLGQSYCRALVFFDTLI